MCFSWRCGLILEYLPSIHRASGSKLSTVENCVVGCVHKCMGLCLILEQLCPSENDPLTIVIPFPSSCTHSFSFYGLPLLDISHGWNHVPGSVTSCFLIAMFVVHSCSTYQCWHMPDAIPCMNIGPCFSIHQLVNVLSFTFWPLWTMLPWTLVYWFLYEHVFSSLGYPSMPRHKTGRWHTVI